MYKWSTARDVCDSQIYKWEVSIFIVKMSRSFVLALNTTAVLTLTLQFCLTVSLFNVRWNVAILEAPIHAGMHKICKRTTFASIVCNIILWHVYK